MYLERYLEALACKIQDKVHDEQVVDANAKDTQLNKAVDKFKREKETNRLDRWKVWDRAVVMIVESKFIKPETTEQCAEQSNTE